MKEATGELNMTVITVVAIAAIAAFFYAFVWPAVKKNIETNQKCANAACPTTCTSGQKCECECSDGKSTEKVWCTLDNSK